eukprot:SAG31_NODE_551_length_14207_cov_7.887440_6_plen_1285_part_00
MHQLFQWKEDRKKIELYLRRVILKVFLFVYGPSTLASLRMLICKPLDETCTGDSCGQMLVMDISVDCRSDDYMSAFFVASSVLILFVFVVPVILVLYAKQCVAERAFQMQLSLKDCQNWFNYLDIDSSGRLEGDEIISLLEKFQDRQKPPIKLCGRRCTCSRKHTNGSGEPVAIFNAASTGHTAHTRILLKKVKELQSTVTRSRFELWCQDLNDYAGGREFISPFRPSSFTLRPCFSASFKAFCFVSFFVLTTLEGGEKLLTGGKIHKYFRDADSDGSELLEQDEFNSVVKEIQRYVEDHSESKIVKRRCCNRICFRRERTFDDFLVTHPIRKTVISRRSFDQWAAKLQKIQNKDGLDTDDVISSEINMYFEQHALADQRWLVKWRGQTLKAQRANQDNGFQALATRAEHERAELVIAEPPDGSAALTNTNAKGKIVLMQNGNGPYWQKALHAQNAGAIAVITYSNRDGGPMMDGNSLVAITIPIVTISQDDGIRIAAAATAGSETVSICNKPSQLLLSEFKKLTMKMENDKTEKHRKKEFTSFLEKHRPELSEESIVTLPQFELWYTKLSSEVFQDPLDALHGTLKYEYYWWFVWTLLLKFVVSMMMTFSPYITVEPYLFMHVALGMTVCALRLFEPYISHIDQKFELFACVSLMSCCLVASIDFSDGEGETVFLTGDSFKIDSVVISVWSAVVGFAIGPFVVFFVLKSRDKHGWKRLKVRRWMQTQVQSAVFKERIKTIFKADLDKKEQVLKGLVDAHEKKATRDLISIKKVTLAAGNSSLDLDAEKKRTWSTVRSTIIARRAFTEQAAGSGDTQRPAGSRAVHLLNTSPAVRVKEASVDFPPIDEVKAVLRNILHDSKQHNVQHRKQFIDVKDDAESLRTGYGVLQAYCQYVQYVAENKQINDDAYDKLENDRRLAFENAQNEALEAKEQRDREEERETQHIKASLLELQACIENRARQIDVLCAFAIGLSPNKDNVENAKIVRVDHLPTDNMFLNVNEAVDEAAIKAHITEKNIGMVEEVVMRSEGSGCGYSGGHLMWHNKTKSMPRLGWAFIKFASAEDANALIEVGSLTFHHLKCPVVCAEFPPAAADLSEESLVSGSQDHRDLLRRSTHNIPTLPGTPNCSSLKTEQTQNFDLVVEEVEEPVQARPSGEVRTTPSFANTTVWVARMQRQKQSFFRRQGAAIFIQAHARRMLACRAHRKLVAPRKHRADHYDSASYLAIESPTVDKASWQTTRYQPDLSLKPTKTLQSRGHLGDVADPLRSGEDETRLAIRLCEVVDS